MTLERDQRDGWLQAGIDLVCPERDGVLSVTWELLKAPVATAMRLAFDTSYRGYWNFMFSAIGANLVFVFFLVPTAAKLLFGVQTPDHTADRLIVQILQLSGFPLLTFAQFYACRALSTKSPSPLSYVKLCALSVGLGWVLLTIAYVVEVVVVSVMIMQGVEVDGVKADQTATFVGALASLSFVILSHRQFWSFSTVRALSVTLAMATVSWVIVYPGLNEIAQRLQVSETLNAILK